MPDEDYISMPYALWGQLSHALLTSSRVCLVDIAGWDRSLISDDKKFLSAMGAVITRLSASHQFAKQNWLGEADDTILERVITKFGWMRKWFEEHTGQQSRPTIDGEAAMQNVDIDANELPEIQQSIFMDSRFWEEIMAECQLLPEAYMATSIPAPALY